MDESFQTAPVPRAGHVLPVPTPTKPRPASRIPLHQNAVAVFEENIKQYKEENQLLGKLLQDAQADARKAENKAAVAQRKATEAHRQQLQAQKDLKTGTCPCRSAIDTVVRGPVKQLQRPHVSDCVEC